MRSRKKSKDVSPNLKLICTIKQTKKREAFMAAVAIYIVAESRAAGKPMALARVEDRQAVLNAAEAAIAEAEARAEAADGLLAQLQRGEVEQLRRSLQLVIPELRLRTSSLAAVM
jgi:hypothetical protein